LEKHQVDLQWGELDQQEIRNVQRVLLSFDRRLLLPGGRLCEKTFGPRPAAAFSFRKLRSGTPRIFQHFQPSFDSLIIP
jgi:hypothetical protein